MFLFFKTYAHKIHTCGVFLHRESKKAMTLPSFADKFSPKAANSRKMGRIVFLRNFAA